MKPRSIRTSYSDLIFDIGNYTLFTVILLIVLYPLYWVVIASISSPDFVASGQLWLWPKGITFEGYKTIFHYDKIWIGYGNTLIYTILGTAINVGMTLTAGYALSRDDMPGRGFFMFLITLTMFFAGGLIPSYLVVRDLGLENTIWSQVLPGAVSAFNLIIAKTFFQSTIPKELLESAMMDGCKNIKFFYSIALPLSLPLVAVITIFSAVGHWNSYFSALIYLRDEGMYPLQLMLRNILVLQVTDASIIDPTGSRNFEEKRKIAEQIKYGVIIVSSLPLLMLYPFLQKYFVKGMMVGSIKG